MAKSVETPVEEKDSILSLSTAIEPAEKVKVDGEEFEILGFRHLSDEDEAEVVALLARYDNLSMQLVTTNDDREAVAVARKLRAKRVALLTKLTTIPEKVLVKLPPTEQIKLTRVVQSMASVTPEEDGDDKS